ncbi:MAG: cytochrome c [Vicinamibacterales bacterium]
MAAGHHRRPGGRPGQERERRRLHRRAGGPGEAYRKECNSCHGDGLEGDGFAPGLAGGEFMSNWNGTTIGDLYDRIRISMPPGNPAAVPPQVKADIIAFMLKANKFPTGQAELTVDTLKPIKFELPK